MLIAPRAALPSILALAALAVPVLVPAVARAWTPVPASTLDVTSGSIATLGSGALQTASPGMRAVERDRGRHAASALLRFRLRGPSAQTAPLGSGEVRRQIGLKLRAGDPCNLVYVMWRQFPERSIVVSAKRNPGQTTSAQCGNRGYVDIARVPRPGDPAATDTADHRLEVRTRVRGDGTLVVTVVADGDTVLVQRVPAGLAQGLDGPAGVRSDNGRYRFRLSVANRGR